MKKKLNRFAILRLHIGFFANPNTENGNIFEAPMAHRAFKFVSF